MAWLTLGLIATTGFLIITQNVLSAVWLQEGVTYMHAAVFMLGAAYTWRHNEHVRVDIFYQRFGERGRAWVNLLGTLLLLLPFSAFIAYEGWLYAADSWAIMEGSSHTDGLPLMFLFKSFIPAMALLMCLQALGEIARCADCLLHTKSRRDDAQ